jgi:hypothetical protein
MINLGMKAKQIGCATYKLNAKYFFLLFLGELRLRDIYHKPLVLLAENNYDDLIRGLV